MTGVSYICAVLLAQEVSAAAVISMSLLSQHGFYLPSCPDFSLLFVHSSYPLLKLPLPGTGPVEFTTPVKDYSPPPLTSDHKPGEPNEQPEWVGAQHVLRSALGFGYGLAVAGVLRGVRVVSF